MDGNLDSIESTALLAANQQEDLNEQRFYELDHWEAATRAVVSHGRVPKHDFIAALTRTPSYIVSLGLPVIIDNTDTTQQHTWTPGSVRLERPNNHLDPAPERQPVTPLPIRHNYRSPAPSDQARDAEPYAESIPDRTVLFVEEASSRSLTLSLVAREVKKLPWITAEPPISMTTTPQRAEATATSLSQNVPEVVVQGQPLLTSTVVITTNINIRRTMIMNMARDADSRIEGQLPAVGVAALPEPHVLPSNALGLQHVMNTADAQSMRLEVDLASIGQRMITTKSLEGVVLSSLRTSYMDLDRQQTSEPTFP